MTFRGRFGDNTFSLEGVLRQSAEQTPHHLNLDVKGRNLAAVTGLILSDTHPFRAKGGIAFDARGATIRDFSARVGNSDVSGEISIDLDDAQNTLSGQMSSQLIDLRHFSSVGSGDAPDVGDSRQANSERLFGEVPLPIEMLQRLNAEMAVDVNRFRYGEADLTNVSLKLRARAGQISLDLLGATVGESGLKGYSKLNLVDEIPSILLDVEAQKVDAGQVLAAFDVTDLMTATTDVRIDVHGKGHSLREILSGLQGRASVIADSGRIDSKYFELVVADLARELLPWRPKNQHTEINCFVARFNIRDGVAETDGLLLDTTRATIAGEGRVDLETEQLNFTVRPNPKELTLVSLAFPIDVRGTIFDPKFRPNKASLAIDAAKVAVGTAINPLGILIPFVRSGLGDKNPCVAALEEPFGSSPDRSPKRDGLGGKLLEGLGGAMKGIGGAVDKVLGR